MRSAIKLSSRQTREFWEVPVLYEDDQLLGLEKPAGLLTAPDPNAPGQPSLLKLLHDGIAEQKPWAAERGLGYLANFHRLDFEASGIIVLSKSKETQTYLANLFGSERANVRYVAITHGIPSHDSFEVDAKLAPDPAVPHRTKVDRRHGKKSRTRFTILEKFRGWALLRCEPQPDRPHQVRVHLRSVGLPVVCDALYGGKPLLLSKLKPGYQPKTGGPERPLFARPALHAEEVSLAHPKDGESLVLTAPWPKDFEVGLKYLRQYAGGV